MHTKFDSNLVAQVSLAGELQIFMDGLSQNFARYGDFHLFLVGSFIHDLIFASEMPKANDVDLVLFIPKDQKNFLPILASFFACPHVPGLYQLKVMGRYKVDLMVIEADIMDPTFLEKHVICKHDFSISSLFCDSRGRIYDPSGRGLKDLRTKTLDLVADLSLSEVINHLTCLRALKYVQRGFSLSPQLHAVLLGISYKTAFDDPHFCTLLRRLITHQMAIVESILRLGFLEKFLDKKFDLSSIHLREIHERLVMKTLKLTTIAELKEELDSLVGENTDLATEIEAMQVDIQGLQAEIFDTRLKTEPMKMRLSELEDKFEALKLEMRNLEREIEVKRESILSQTKILNQLLAEKHALTLENLGLKEGLEKQEVKSQVILKQDELRSQKLTQKLSKLKEKQQDLDQTLGLATSQRRRLMDEFDALAVQTETLDKAFEDKRKLFEEGQSRYREKLQHNVDRLLRAETIPERYNQTFSIFEPHPWDKVDSTNIDFIFKNWHEDMLKLPLGLRLARDFVFKREDYKAILVLIFCQYLAEKHPHALAEKIDYFFTKIKLKYSRIYWQVKSAKEWYDLAQQFYSFGQCSEALAFYFLAHQVDKNYIHPMIQIINAAIKLKDWTFLELGLDSLAKFKNAQASQEFADGELPKHHGHAIKILAGVYQKLICEYHRLAGWVSSPELMLDYSCKLWDLLAIYRLLHLEVFREQLAGETKPLIAIKEIYHKILAVSEPESFSKLIAHLNLAALAKSPGETELHFEAAVEMNLLPKLEGIYAASSRDVSASSSPR